MINKKYGLAVLATAGLLALVGCGPTGGSTGPGGGSTASSEAPLDPASLSLWCPEGDNAAYQAVIDAFEKANPGVTVEITENVAENAVGDRLVSDASACADVMAIADDNIRKAVNANALARLGTTYTEYVVEHCGEGVLDAVSINGNTYAFPHRADNSYVLIYDNQKLSATDVLSLETIIQKCATNGWDFCFDISDAWYSPAYFWATGGEFTPNADGTEIDANFLNPTVLAGLQHISDLYKEYGATINTTGGLVASLDNANINFNDQTAAVIQWNNIATYEAQVNDPDRIVATSLPSMEVNGTSYEFKAFNGFKGMCINNTTATGSDTAKARAAYALARYFVSDEGAKVFFDATKYGVTNLTVVEDPAYSSNKFNVALGGMVAAGRTVGQGVSVTDDFWTPMTNFGDCIVNNAKTASQWGDYASVKEAVTGILGDSKGWSIHD